MKYPITHIATAILWLMSLSTKAQLVAIEIDTVVVHAGLTADGVDLTGYTTYRLYAVCQNENDIVKGMNASTSISTANNQFWQSPLGDHFASSISCFELDNFESSAYDSWLTVNAESGCNTNAQLVSYNCGGMYGQWTTSFETAGGVSFWSMWEGCNGSYSTSSNVIGLAGPSHRVLLGQFTSTSPIFAQVTVTMYINGNTNSTMSFEYACVASDNNMVQGCTDPNACNFDPLATWDNCTCIASGCTDPSACNFDEVATCDNGLCVYGNLGCGQSTACNYDPSAACIDYSLCTYPGCMDPNACNYSSSAGCDNGSCLLGSVVRGYVYYDPTPEMTWNNNPTANGMSGIALHMLPEDIYAFSDLDGYYEFPVVPDGPHSIQVILPEGEFMFAEDGYNAFNTPYCSMQYYGISPTGLAPFAVVTPASPNNNIIHCTNGGQHGFWLHNTGTTVMSGELSLQLDNGLEASQGTNVLALEPNFIGMDSLSWTIPLLSPGDEILIQTFIAGPGTNWIGQNVSFQYQMVLVDDTLGVFVDTTWSQNIQVVCAYDPNDKTTIPVGYGDNHYVLAGDTLEYQIQFQNTGNYPAETVTILDQIDTTRLDLNTFEHLSASHNMQLQIEPNGLIHFIFNDIQLPDSSANEAASHGFVTFRIQLKSNVQPNEVTQNTAYIYFDANPAIVTNTTAHQIFDCQWLALPEESLAICSEPFTWSAALDFEPDSYIWHLDNAALSNTNNTLDMDLTAGTHSLQLTASNPLCNVVSSIEINVLDSLIVEIIYDGETIMGSAGYTYQWYINGTWIPNETTFSILPWDYIQDGFYAYAIVTDANGCQGQTNIVSGSDQSEMSKNNIHCFPNPAHDVLSWALPESGSTLQWFDAMGRCVYIENACAANHQSQLSSLRSGLYHVQCQMNQMTHTYIRVVVDH